MLSLQHNMADRDKESPPKIPFVDERIEFRGTTYLRSLNVEALKDLDKVIVLQTESGERLAVLIGYERYLVLQKIAMGEKR